eukprot:gene1233-32577_t
MPAGSDSTGSNLGDGKFLRKRFSTRSTESHGSRQGMHQTHWQPPWVHGEDVDKQPGILETSDVKEASNASHSFEKAVFGVLYTLSKSGKELEVPVFTEGPTPLHSWALTMNPPHTAVALTFMYLNTSNVISDAGYTTTVIALYTITGLMIANLALCIYV